MYVQTRQETIHILRSMKPSPVVWELILSEDAIICHTITRELEKPSVETCCLPFAQIQQVVAFKRDCLVVDLLCLQFLTRENTTVEIHDEMVGFDQLLEKLPEILPGFPPMSEWWQGVVQPPFAENYTQLWDTLDQP